MEENNFIGAVDKLGRKLSLIRPGPSLPLRRIYRRKVFVALSFSLVLLLPKSMRRLRYHQHSHYIRRHDDDGVAESTVRP